MRGRIGRLRGKNMINDILAAAKAMPGDTAMWYMDLETGAQGAYNEDKPLVAASVIKLFIMAEAFRAMEAGEVGRDTEFVKTSEMNMPSCGALNYMHDGLKVTFIDLVTLMIILSDNTATNMLIDYLGRDKINAAIEHMGAQGCVLNRRLFDAEASRRGIQNYITAAGVGRFFRMLHEGKLVSEGASREMLEILKNQRLNGKIPFFLDCKIAHKTGEDTGITHDAGIVYSEKPFILVMLSNNTDVPKYERFMQDAARELAER
jgi:beta-lactamase class A